jgi:hypothetical protein
MPSYGKARAEQILDTRSTVVLTLPGGIAPPGIQKFVSSNLKRLCKGMIIVYSSNTYPMKNKPANSFLVTSSHRVFNVIPIQPAIVVPRVNSHADRRCL